MVLLGSTGSIGLNALLIAKRFGIEVEALVAGKNIALLNEQIKEHHPKYVAIADEKDRSLVNHPHVFVGKEGILELMQKTESFLVVNALVGFVGLAPSIEALRLGKRLALANKESLVVAGHLLDTKKITPIDSEHFGLWYLLGNRPISKMIITASGGAFRDTPLEKLASMSFEDALKHPNWSMGPKITIDSATMTNKLFELLEAKWLFGCEKLDAIIEPKSIIHAFVDFQDGSTTAHLAKADMKLPIAFALLGEVQEAILPPIDLVSIGSFSFQNIDKARYPIWEIKDDVLANPKRGVVINAANEVGIAQFYNREISILELAERTKKAYRFFEDALPQSLDEVFQIDKEVRHYCLK
ncbi:1-deoxy-D-xylulose-5-phosphate reductoisomerase [Sulfurospirillum barnesii]|uniref:1-deoxy-D-xylulose 5-phosphate reductoisomerase n=1 Tax=Sulfurospirillum barnesii (strain ATCC 700032 / DSM 10660 / SES-3) TaxID=760154 RepID=I3Y0Q3_SULBS|nr:1-deoxy-D-xylulose-5-phosphate reductoisomerase [Sulfurospirillum barnesii]AFL69777.1 1-deoxy-D-xylulose 5-phosphate reductoisomerase [Sulfurospirillum barnesii SES-3]